MEPSKYIEQLFNAYVEASINEVLENKIIEESPDYKWLLKEYYEGILLFEIMEKEVWNKATEDTVGQRNFFNANASKYQAKERIRGKIYSSPSKEHLDELQEHIQKNDTAAVQEVIQSHNIKQEAGAYEKEDRAVFSKINWKTGSYRVENNSMNYLIIVNKILPPGPKTFEEARPEVISDYQTHLEKNWIEQLKKKYPIKINKKGKQIVMQQLIKAQNGHVSKK